MREGEEEEEKRWKEDEESSFGDEETESADPLSCTEQDGACGASDIEERSIPCSVGREEVQGRN